MKNLTSLVYLIIYMCALLIPNLAHAQAAPGAGTVDNPYLISTPAQLDAVRNDKTAHYKLVANINLADYLSSGGDGYNSGAGWQPIGAVGPSNNLDLNAFKGTFDGNGHTISGLFINNTNTNTSLSSLFGRLGSGAVVKDLGVTDVNITSAGTYVGAIAGRLNDNSLITGCYTSGTISTNSSTSYVYAGGIVGYAENSSRIENCHSLCTVSTSGVYAGGIAGYIESGSVITNCYATGSITGYYYVGGVVGVWGENCIVQNSVAANGSITLTAGSSERCRRIGTRSLGSIITGNNYANSGMTVNITASQTASENQDGIGKTLAELQTEAFYTTSGNWYNGEAWDFENVWAMDEVNSLPLLLWQYNADDEVAPLLSLPLSGRVSHTEVIIGFTTGEAGTAYCLVLEPGATPPSASEVHAAYLLGTAAAGAITKTITLTEGAKDVYVVVEDRKGNISEPLLIAVAAFDPANAGIRINGGTP